MEQDATPRTLPGGTVDDGRVDDDGRIRAFAIEAARSLADDKCEDVLLLDVRGLSQVCDYLVIGSGTSDRQMRGAAGGVEKIADSAGLPCFRRSVDARTTWVLLDFVDVVVHVFEPNTRAHYDLEMLWSDAPQVSWRRRGRPRPPGGDEPAEAQDSAGAEPGESPVGDGPVDPPETAEP